MSREPTAHYREMQNELADLRREQSFAISDLPHGGSHREKDVIRYRLLIHDLMERMERVERDGGRWEH